MVARNVGEVSDAHKNASAIAVVLWRPHCRVLGVNALDSDGKAVGGPDSRTPMAPHPYTAAPSTGDGATHVSTCTGIAPPEAPARALRASTPSTTICACHTPLATAPTTPSLPCTSTSEARMFENKAVALSMPPAACRRTPPLPAPVARTLWSTGLGRRWSRPLRPRPRRRARAHDRESWTQPVSGRYECPQRRRTRSR